MAKILIAEDDHSCKTILSDTLALEHHTTEIVGDGADAMQLITYSKYDLIILDCLLPGLPAPDICRRFRAEGGTTPVLIISELTDVHEKVRGLDSGADDYLTKPFHPRELLARVRALLRRPERIHQNALSLANARLDREHYSAYIEGSRVSLHPQEFNLLEFFMRRPHQVFTVEMLWKAVWKSDSDASPDAVRQCIKRLRMKIDNAGSRLRVTNVYGVGYKLEAA